MKMHQTTIDKLVKIFENYGGHREQIKLKTMLASLDMSVYKQNSGKEVLVLTEEMVRKVAEIKDAGQ